MKQTIKVKELKRYQEKDQRDILYYHREYEIEYTDGDVEFVKISKPNSLSRVAVEYWICSDQTFDGDKIKECRKNKWIDYNEIKLMF